MSEKITKSDYVYKIQPSEDLHSWEILRTRRHQYDNGHKHIVWWTSTGKHIGSKNGAILWVEQLISEDIKRLQTDEYQREYVKKETVIFD